MFTVTSCSPWSRHTTPGFCAQGSKNKSRFIPVGHPRCRGSSLGPAHFDVSGRFSKTRPLHIGRIFRALSRLQNDRRTLRIRRMDYILHRVVHLGARAVAIVATAWNLCACGGGGTDSLQMTCGPSQKTSPIVWSSVFAPKEASSNPVEYSLGYFYVVVISVMFCQVAPLL